MHGVAMQDPGRKACSRRRRVRMHRNCQGRSRMFTQCPPQHSRPSPHVAGQPPSPETPAPPTCATSTDAIEDRRWAPRSGAHADVNSAIAQSTAGAGGIILRGRVLCAARDDKKIMQWPTSVSGHHLVASSTLLAPSICVRFSLMEYFLPVEVLVVARPH